jgi:signal transduction histidine kinase
LIDDLLDASRLQAGALVLNRAEVELNHLAQRIVKKFEVQTEKHNFEIRFPAEFPIVIADEDRLTQVLNNLISNAVKYSAQGGTIQISGQASEDEVRVCVRDDGPGIAPEDVPFIFDRFYRSNDAAENTKGTGLGLYLAKAIVEAHGGRIWVNERIKKGASICFALPR